MVQHIVFDCICIHAIVHRLFDLDTLHLDRFGQSVELMVNRFETIERVVDYEFLMIAYSFFGALCQILKKNNTHTND